MTARTDTPLKDRVLDAIPGYRDAQRRYERLSAAYQITPTVTDLNVAYIDRIGRAADTETDLAELQTAYTSDRQKWEHDAEFHYLVAQARDLAHAEMASATTNGADHALDFLRDELAALMRDVNKNRDILATHPATAEQAIGSGADGLKRWKTAESLIARYGELRAEHRRYAILQDDHAQRDFMVVAQIARFLEADPYWRYRRSTTPGQNSTDPGIAGWFNVPSGMEGHRTDMWPATYTRAQWLLIVADNEPWLPSGEEIGRARDLADQLFIGRKSYRNSVEIRGFCQRITDLAEMGVTAGIVVDTAKTA